jgi:hypothetical protein
MLALLIIVPLGVVVTALMPQVVVALTPQWMLALSIIVLLAWWSRL